MIPAPEMKMLRTVLMNRQLMKLLIKLALFITLDKHGTLLSSVFAY